MRVRARPVHTRTQAPDAPQPYPLGPSPALGPLNPLVPAQRLARPLNPLGPSPALGPPAQPA
eukprot:362159-Chlamydomonas_euryale.AAC.1